MKLSLLTLITSVLLAAPPPLGTETLTVSCGAVCTGNAYLGTGDTVQILGSGLKKNANYDIEVVGGQVTPNRNSAHADAAGHLTLDYGRIFFITDPYMPGTYTFNLYRHNQNVILATVTAEMVAVP